MIGCRRAIRFAIAIVVLCELGPAAQTPARDASRKDPADAANATPIGSGSISGVVTTLAASPAALRMVTVVLVGNDTGVMRMTMTDGEGRFAFQHLPVDRYAIAASRPSYLPMSAGARRPGHPGTPIALGDGQGITDITIRMPLGAAIGGTILDERGRPARGVAIGIHPVRMESGVRRLAPPLGQLTITDEFGRYRVYGLAPGSYAVVGMPLSGSRFEHPTLTDAQVDAVLRGEPAPSFRTFETSTLVSAVPVYFPGTTRMSDAQILTLATGDDRRQVDFRMQWGRSSKVEGIVLSSDGRPLSDLRVSLSNEAGSALQSTRTTTVADGRFSIEMVPPGTYTLLARTNGTPTLVGAIPVNVDGADVTGLQLTMLPSLTLTGRVMVEGSATAAGIAGRTIGLLNLSDATWAQSRPVDSKGTMVIPDMLPGRYLFRPPALGMGAAGLTLALQSVTADGVDITDLPMTLTQDAPPKEILVTLGDRWQQVAGRLTDSAGNGVSDYTVLMFPVNEAYWLYQSRRIVTSRPATDGRFGIGGPGPALLPAGDYYLAAVTDVSKDEQYDPAFLQSLIPAALKITVKPGEKSTHDLRVR